MASTEETKIPLRFLVDKEKKKVVFAEADNDFVDILFSFLTLPMGTIVRLLSKHFGSQVEPIGSLSTLYGSLANLDPKHFWTEECKDLLLNPRNSSDAVCCKLKLNIDDTEPTKYLICENWDCSRNNISYLSPYYTLKCKCGKLMNREIGLKGWDLNTSYGKGGAFVIETAAFIISDDLRVMPNLPTSSLELLDDLGIRDMRGLEERTFNVGFKEILILLKLSLFSRTPLTDLVFCKKPTSSNFLKSEPRNLNQPESETDDGTTTNSKTLTVKVMLQKSKNKVLLAQAEESFIDFLFSFLSVPLGSVGSLLGGNTCMGSIDNLYKSVSSLSVGRYMKSEALKDMIHHPLLPPIYLCDNQIFPLKEPKTEYYCYSHFSVDFSGYLTTSKEYHGYYGEFNSKLIIKDPKVNGGFVRAATMFTVTDDLVVTPLSSISTISFLNRSSIPLNDVEEHVFNVGIDEALSILKASLNSASALTNGLNLILKNPNHEDGSL